MFCVCMNMYVCENSVSSGCEKFAKFLSNRLIYFGDSPISSFEMVDFPVWLLCLHLINAMLKDWDDILPEKFSFIVPVNPRKRMTYLTIRRPIPQYATRCDLTSHILYYATSLLFTWQPRPWLRTTESVVRQEFCQSKAKKQISIFLYKLFIYISPSSTPRPLLGAEAWAWVPLTQSDIKSHNE